MQLSFREAGKGGYRRCREPVLDVTFWLRSVTDSRVPNGLMALLK